MKKLTKEGMMVDSDSHEDLVAIMEENVEVVASKYPEKSGCLQLPSQRTLRDYTYYNKACIGFSAGTDEELLQLIKTIRNCLSNKKCHLWVSVNIAHLDKSFQAKFIPLCSSV